MSSALRLFAFIGFAWAGLRADVMLAPLFQDHAVLQRDKPLPVWGHADPGEEVVVAFGGQRVTASADEHGRWRVQLKPLAASAVPASLSVSGKTSVTVQDLLVGDVWLCSGQSNMAWSVGAADNPDAEISAANWPLIRQIKIGLAVADGPQDAVAGSWSVCSPCSVGTFGAVGYYFARHVYRRLQVPIGIVNCSFGGSSIEAWLSPAALDREPGFAFVKARWRQAVSEVSPQRRSDYDRAFSEWTAAVERIERDPDGSVRPAKPWPPPGPGSFATPSCLLNGMLHPLIPGALRGILWYQGESNAARADEYHQLFTMLINSWRIEFAQGDIPFYWVQLPNYRARDESNMSWAFLREAQTQTLALPATGQAVTIDIGNPDYIHPGNKQEVGRRLALLALVKAYGVTEECSGPEFARAEREGVSVRVHFSHAGGGLTSDDETLHAFELAGPDHVFLPATAALDSETVVVRALRVPEPKWVRYAWQNSPHARLHNGAGLPAGPFRSAVVEKSGRAAPGGP